MLGDTDYFKEKHFFDQADRCSKGFDWYSNRYFHKKGCNYLDATPYIGQPSGEDQLPFALTTAARVFYSVPPAFKAQVRLVALLREPIARLRSWFDHLARQVEGSCDLSTCTHFTCSLAWPCVGRYTALYGASKRLARTGYWNNDPSGKTLAERRNWGITDKQGNQLT